MTPFLNCPPVYVYYNFEDATTRLERVGWEIVGGGLRSTFIKTIVFPFTDQGNVMQGALEMFCH